MRVRLLIRKFTPWCFLIWRPAQQERQNLTRAGGDSSLPVGYVTPFRGRALLRISVEGTSGPLEK